MRKGWVILVFALLKVMGANSPSSSEPVTIPIKLNHGRIIVHARIADYSPLTFVLDSACTIPTLHPELVDELKLTLSDRVRISGIAGEERSPTYRGVVFDLTGATYS